MAQIYGQLKKAGIESLAADPTGTGLFEGRIWFNTVSGVIRYYDGSTTHEFADLDTAQTFLNKTLTSPTINTPTIDTPTINGEQVLEEQASAPSTPAAGYKALYPKTDGKVYTLDSAGIEREIGGGGSGAGSGFPLIEGDNTNFDSTVGDWQAYQDAAAASPVDMNGGTPTVTVTRTTSSPLVGDASLLITKDAANRQGEGASLINIAIPDGYLGQPLLVRLIGEGSVNYADGDLVLYSYDETNAEIIGNGPLVNQDDGALPQARTIVEAIVYPKDNTASVTIGAHIATTNASAWTFKADQIEFNWVPYIQLPNIGNWKSYTPTTNWSGTYNAYYRIVGDTAEFRIEHTLNAVPSGAYQIDLPNNWTFSDAVIKNSTYNYSLGIASVGDNDDSQKTRTSGDALAAGGQNAIRVRYASTNSVYLSYGNALVAASQPITFASGDVITTHFSAPIEELSANTTEALAINGGLLSEEKLLSADVTTNTTISDFTVSNLRVGSKYIVSGQMYIDTSGGGGADTIIVELTHNGGVVGVVGSNQASGEANYYAVSCEFVATTTSLTFVSVGINAGNSIRGNGARSESYVQVQEVPFSQTALMQRNIGFLATSDAGNAIPDNTVTDIVFEDQQFDNLGGYNNSTGVYTAPAAGLYDVDATVVLSGLTAGTGELVMYITDGSNNILRVVYEDAIENAFQSANGSTKLFLNEGDQIKVRIVHNNGASRNIGANSNSCSFSAAKVV